MRPRCAPVLAVTLVAALAGPALSPGPAAAAPAMTPAAASGVPSWAVPLAPRAGVRPPSCAADATAPDGAEAVPFPVRAEILDGPRRYRPGDAPASWRIQLTNTTGAPCAGIHPVVVLVDRARALTSAQVRLEFRDPEGEWHPVGIEHTDQDENIGVFGSDPSGSPTSPAAPDSPGPSGFSGFQLGPKQRQSIAVRLAFAPGTRPDSRKDAVVAKVALVQRRDDDGDWVGESAAYKFSLDRPVRRDATEPNTDPETGTSPPADPSSPATEDGARRSPGTDPDTDPGRNPDADTGTEPGQKQGTGTLRPTPDSTGYPGHPESPYGTRGEHGDTDHHEHAHGEHGEHGGPPDRLAETGDSHSEGLTRLAAASAALILLGTGMITAARRGFGRTRTRPRLDNDPEQ